MKIETRHSHQGYRGAITLNGKAYCTDWHDKEAHALGEILLWLIAQGDFDEVVRWLSAQRRRPPTDEAWEVLELLAGATA